VDAWIDYATMHVVFKYIRHQWLLFYFQDRLQSLLKAAESLQVKGLADITGDGGTAVNSTGPGKDEAEFMPSGDDSNPASPAGVSSVDRKGDSGINSVPEQPIKRKRGRPPMNPHVDNSSMGNMLFVLWEERIRTDAFPWLDTYF